MAQVYKRKWSKTIDGKRVAGESRYYTIVYTDENGVEQKRRGFTDLAASQTLALKLESEAAQVRAGLLPRAALDGAKRRLVCPDCKSSGMKKVDGKKTVCECLDGFHLTDYRDHLRACESSGEHVSKTVQRIGKAFTACGFDTIKDLNADKLEKWLAGQRKTASLSYSSSNHYLRASRLFMSYLAERDAIVSDPFRRIEFLNSEEDRRRVRRSVTSEEYQKLLESTLNSGETILEMDPESRYLFYTLAGYTGLRRGELGKLVVGNFDFEASTVTIEAKHAKGGRTDHLPLHPDLAAHLQQWIGNRPANQLVWPKCKGTQRTAEMLQADLARCEIPYKDDRGHVFDFHGLRGQFLVELSRQKVHPRTAQLLARHSSIDLTMNVYTNLSRVDLVQAVESLPSPRTNAPTTEPQTMRATGTDGKPADGADRKVRQLTEKSTHSGGLGRTGTNEVEQAEPSKSTNRSESQPVEVERERTRANSDEREVSTSKGSGPSRIRTGNQGIMSPDAAETQSVLKFPNAQDLEQAEQEAETGACSKVHFPSGVQVSDDPGLIALIQSWPTLPDHIRQTIKSIIASVPTDAHKPPPRKPRRGS